MKLSLYFFLATIALGSSKSLRGGNKKLLPNGQACNYCPDDDDYVWPPDNDWQPPPAEPGTRKLKAGDAEESASNLEEAVSADATNERSLKGKLLPNGQACNYCPDDDDYVWPPDNDWQPPPAEPGTRKLEAGDAEQSISSSLKAAAAAASYEASHLEALANRRDLEADKKALYEKAANLAKYEASVLKEAASLDEAETNNERLLKGKLLPNGQACNYCPDDDDYVWPPDNDWQPPPAEPGTRKLFSWW